MAVTAPNESQNPLCSRYEEFSASIRIAARESALKESYVLPTATAPIRTANITTARTVAVPLPVNMPYSTIPAAAARDAGVFGRCSAISSRRSAMPSSIRCMPETEIRCSRPLC